MRTSRMGPCDSFFYLILITYLAGVSVPVAGNVGTFSASVDCAGAVMLIGASSTVVFVIKAAEMMLSTTMATANPHVAFFNFNYLKL